MAHLFCSLGIYNLIRRSDTELKYNPSQRILKAKRVVQITKTMSSGKHILKKEALFVRWQLFSCLVVSSSLQPHGPQHARLSRPSPFPRAYSNSCPSSQWCHAAISFSVILFSSCPQSLPASESFPMSQLFTRGGKSIGVPASTSVLPMNTQTDLL